MAIKLTLDKLLDERQLTRYSLAQQTGIKFQTVDRYYKNKVVRYDSYILDKICSTLGCTVSDVIEFTAD